MRPAEPPLGALSICFLIGIHAFRFNILIWRDISCLLAPNVMRTNAIADPITRFPLYRLYQLRYRPEPAVDSECDIKLTNERICKGEFSPRKRHNTMMTHEEGHRWFRFRSVKVTPSPALGRIEQVPVPVSPVTNRPFSRADPSTSLAVPSINEPICTKQKRAEEITSILEFH